MKRTCILALTVLFIFCCACIPADEEDKEATAPETIVTGLDRIAEYADLFQGKQVGLVTNHTAYDQGGRHIIDIFLAMDDVNVTALFGPEHGIRGQSEAGEKIDSENDPAHNIPVYSLYGENIRPTEEMLADVDLLVYDIQDIGTRYYTYISTMSYAMESAAGFGKPFVVLDRPNPIRGDVVEGNRLDTTYSSMVGRFRIPVRHGMTSAELAAMMNDRGWLRHGLRVELITIPMTGWDRSSWFDQLHLNYIKPSPNMPDLETAIVYPGTCLLEGTNISEGRGTLTPFRIFGAPWIDGKLLTRKLNDQKIPGVVFRDTSFTPQSIPGMSLSPKFQAKQCYGSVIEVTDRNIFPSYETGIRLIAVLHALYPDQLQWHNAHFDRLCGSQTLRAAILNADTSKLETLLTEFKRDAASFLELREPYLLY